MLAPMNQMFPPRSIERTTQAAEGVPRWRWTTVELERLAALGTFTEYDRFELIGGEIVPMSPTGRRHELVAEELAQFWLPRVPTELRLSQERQFNLDEFTYTKPDLMIRPATIKSPDLRGDTAVLVIEISDSSLGFDLRTKVLQYARFGVREYWVVEAWSLITHVHREPTASGYASVRQVAADVELAPLLVPELKVVMAKLDL
jgi:Uma2 family endonuclease